MLNTSKKVARTLAQLLVEHGIREAVVSPGSRNAPLLVALERQPEINTKVVVDERSAAFIGLGIAIASKRPVALVCTSGTAPLNYGPALAEAFYRQIPLIAVTADRPEEWIDQDDSQTIVQPGIFSNYVKHTFDIPVENNDSNRMWMINRKLNDALILATSEHPGPVHINVRLDEPLGETVDVGGPTAPRLIKSVESTISPDIEHPAKKISDGAKTMIIAGFLPDISELSVHLRTLARLPNVIVLHEAQSNLRGDGAFIPNIDATLSVIGEHEDPEIVITIGGSLTSRKIKAYLRGLTDIEHISVGKRDHSVDCFKRLVQRINADETEVMKRLAERLAQGSGTPSPFKDKWLSASKKALIKARNFAKEASWSDFQASEYIISHIPEGWNLQLSNGTAVRYAQLFDYSSAGSIHCNRGVSGIDGCTSTAIGSATVFEKPTVLLTGDMSMQYDIGALATAFIPKNFKIIVLNNGGGGIFRFIQSTKKLDELEKYFVADVRLPLAQLSEGYGFKYLSAGNPDELKESFEKMVTDNSSPTILEIKTDGEISAETISKFLNS